MGLRNTAKSWGSAARGLHWLMAALIAVQGVVGWMGDGMARSPAKIDVMTAHKSLGITLLLLALARLCWRWASPAPQPQPGSTSLERAGANFVHALLYLLMIALPLSGWLAASTSVVPWKLWWILPWPRIGAPDKALHELAAETHEMLLWSLLFVLAVHVAAALWHHFYRRDRVLRRMWKGA